MHVHVYVYVCVCVCGDRCLFDRNVQIYYTYLYMISSQTTAKDEKESKKEADTATKVVLLAMYVRGRRGWVEDEDEG